MTMMSHIIISLKELEKNCNFNHDKLRTRTSKIPFFVSVISKEGINPDSKKLEVITHMDSPEDKRQLASFVGLVKYLNTCPTQLLTTKEETVRDPTLNEFAKVIMARWLADRSVCLHTLLLYWNFREEVGIQNSVLLKGNKVMVQPSLQ